MLRGLDGFLCGAYIILLCDFHVSFGEYDVIYGELDILGCYFVITWSTLNTFCWVFAFVTHKSPYKVQWLLREVYLSFREVYLSFREVHLSFHAVQLLAHMQSAVPI